MTTQPLALRHAPNSAAKAQAVENCVPFIRASPPWDRMSTAPGRRRQVPHHRTSPVPDSWPRLRQSSPQPYAPMEPNHQTRRLIRTGTTGKTSRLIIAVISVTVSRKPLTHRAPMKEVSAPSSTVLLADPAPHRHTTMRENEIALQAGGGVSSNRNICQLAKTGIHTIDSLITICGRPHVGGRCLNRIPHIGMQCYVIFTTLMDSNWAGLVSPGTKIIIAQPHQKIGVSRIEPNTIRQFRWMLDIPQCQIGAQANAKPATIRQAQCLCRMSGHTCQRFCWCHSEQSAAHVHC